MKHQCSAFLLFLFLLAASPNLLAQPKHSLAFRPTWYNYQSPLSTSNLKFSDVYGNTTGQGVEVSYYNRLFKNTYLAIPLKLGTTSFPDASGFLGRKEVLGNLDVLLQHNFFKHGNIFNPFLHAGIGTAYNIDQSDFGLNFPVAIGLNVKILENLYASVQTQHRFSTNDLDGWHHGVGLHVFFGGEASPPPITDRDGDGINDPDDRCPDQAGPLATQGCPDADADGIADKDDKCPNEPGPAALGGCPDRDGDGIVDKDDKCPDQAGPKVTLGCPDRDNDGIADADDDCPDEAGPAATKGCPDRDGDGIADKNDLCPDKKGTLAGKGCPDTDGDGVYDNEDRCPDKAGPASNKGCPEIKAEDKAILANVVKNVQFATGSANLLASSYAVLDEVVALMQRYPEYQLTISGHTDSIGDDKMNQALSEKRAKACYDYLTKKGVPAARMSHAGYGESKPVADNRYESGRKQNRRVEFDLGVN